MLDFLNTIDVEDGTDLLADPAGWRAWLTTRGLSEADSTADTAAESTAGSTAALRTALRAAVGEPSTGQPGLSARVTVSIGADGPRLVADDVVGAVLAAASRLAVLGEWDRIKICPADGCRWAFFDRSRNHSRTWCSMRVCGNREKARAWRERARANG
ncbi:MAG: CGNR zinc finger domain-containing protein [Actinophytocola sp.]|uniref:CGNR zinc finger domain-containing protein n=1 Tax=Actinophytocola sp. TaxID=1872138 RepID=UPI003D6A5D05